VQGWSLFDIESITITFDDDEEEAITVSCIDSKETVGHKM